ncbi:hypothetical protein IM40_02645 [Candidatus Paracaedimonas acanthamoebae]|nr:hypothetical protein IM40_02645 [Candidatus Paracaedimonas acanthamoebae]
MKKVWMSLVLLTISFANTNSINASDVVNEDVSGPSGPTTVSSDPTPLEISKMGPTGPNG